MSPIWASALHRAKWPTAKINRRRRRQRLRAPGTHASQAARNKAPDAQGRPMNIHEYQAKVVLKQFGAPVPRGFAAFTPDEAGDAAAKLGGSLWVVKSQIHAGGRGKGTFKEADAGEKGGVRLARSVDEVKTFARQ